MGPDLDERRAMGWILPIGLAILLLAAAACLAYGMWQQSRRDVVTAYLEVRAAADNKPQSAQEHEQMLATHLHLIGSAQVVSAALNTPGVSSLPSVVRQADPMSWLGSQLHISFHPDSPIIELRFDAEPGEGDDGAKILQALIDAYLGIPATGTSPEVRVIQGPVVTEG